MQREQRTFIAVKPDGVKRGLVGEIIKRFENRGFKLIGLKMLDVTPEMAEKHYGEHKGKPFYERLIEYIQSDGGNQSIPHSRFLCKQMSARQSFCAIIKLPKPPLIHN